MGVLGYARVSTQQQDTALQRAAFAKAGVRKVVEEKRSGGASRPLLEALLGRLKPGDVLVVYKIDRLARSLVDLLRILGRIDAAGATFRSLTEPLETATPVGRMMIQLLGAVAEFERAVIRERCAAGRVAAQERGVRFGRPPVFSLEDARLLREAGLTHKAIGERLGVSASAVGRSLAGGRRCDGGGRRASGAARGRPPAFSLADVQRLRGEGLSFAEVGRRVGASATSVCRAMRHGRVCDLSSGSGIGVT